MPRPFLSLSIALARSLALPTAAFRLRGSHRSGGGHSAQEERVPAGCAVSPIGP